MNIQKVFNFIVWIVSEFDLVFNWMLKWRKYAYKFTRLLSRNRMINSNSKYIVTNLRDKATREMQHNTFELILSASILVIVSNVDTQFSNVNDLISTKDIYQRDSKTNKIVSQSSVNLNELPSAYHTCKIQKIGVFL